MRPDGLSDAVAVLDLQGKVLACNRRLRALLGGGEDAGERLASHLAGLTLLQRAREGGFWKGSLELPAGPRLQLEAERCGELVLVRAGAGPVGVAPEATARVESFARLSEGMAHDARNPLNALSIHLELLGDKIRQADPALADRTGKHVQAAREQVHRIEKVLRRFLRFASPRPDPAGTVDLADLVQQAVEVCGHDARRNGVQVDTHLEVARVSGDVAKLGEAVLQLVMQGIDASASGGRLHIDLGSRGSEAVLCFIDYPSATEPCPKPVASTAGGELPLVAAEQIVELHRGMLSSRTLAGRTEVEVRLPLAGIE